MSYAKPKTKAIPSKEEAQAEMNRQRMAFFANKREMFYANALVAILQNPQTTQSNVEDNVTLALEYADKSFAALYLKEQENEKPAE